MKTLLYLHFDAQGDLRTAAEECEESVFLEAFGNTKEQLNSEYETYNDQSVFIAVSDVDGYVQGTVRLIAPGPAGLKTVNDIAREPWGLDGERVTKAAGIDLAHTWDIATMGVRAECRSNRLMVTMALYHAMMKATRVNEMTSAVAILDSHAQRVMNSLGYIFPAMPGVKPAPYLGSAASTPVYAHYASIVDAQRRINPEAYRLMTLGVGLDGIAIPEESAFLRKAAPLRVRAAERWGVLESVGAA